MGKIIEVFYGGIKKSFKLNKDKLTIGRLGDIKIPEIYNSVSRYHGEFIIEDDTTKYTDHSLVGTGVYDKRVNERDNCLHLEEGDVVKDLSSGKNLEYTVITNPEDKYIVINNRQIKIGDMGTVLFFGQPEINWNGPLAFVKEHY